MEAIKDVISHIFSELQTPKKLRNRVLFEQWPSIAGPKIAPHTKPALGQNGQLIVWVDQSVLAFELRQRYQQSLLKRTQAALGEDVVRTVRFLVGQLR